MSGIPNGPDCKYMVRIKEEFLVLVVLLAIVI